MIPFADKADIDRALPYPALVARLKDAFANPDFVTPMRHHHEVEIPGEIDNATLLLMPAWEPGNSLGVKIVTVMPHNAKSNLPAIHGIYILIDALTGETQMLLDAKSLTVRRTAATSALASSFLSREESSTVLMVGTGALAPELIRAHASVRPINKVLIWGRRKDKAEAVAHVLHHEPFKTVVVSDLNTHIPEADIISCATQSDDPVIFGRFLRPGQHLDLVGSYRPHMRETDDEAIRKSKVFVDTYAGALKECGDMAIPIQSGILSKEMMGAELPELCSGTRKGRQNENEITLFKSVGHALEDLVAAMMVEESR